jgi:CNT family concentrative nucleoside transporter
VIALVGLVVILAIAWLLSTNRRLVPWRTVLVGTGLQLVFAVLILKTAPGRAFFLWASHAVTTFLDFADAGSRFVFGEDFRDHLVAFKVLPTIIFFSSVIAILYHVGLVQKVVRAFAWLMMRLMGTSGAESFSAAGNVFVGCTEAPLLVRPYIAGMTTSELMAVMTGGFATIAGGVFAAYVGMGVEPGHLIAASVMSAPAALVMAKLMYPETEESATAGTVKVDVASPYVNLLDAAAEGAAAGLKLALNVGAMLIAFIALIAVVNAGLGALGGLFGFEGLSLEWIFGQLLRPLAYLMGVPWGEADRVGTLLGIKTVVNEFVAYAQMREMVAAGELSARSEAIATYALCGFSNFATIAITIGGIGAIAPERKADLARLGLRAMVGGALACFQTATIAGLLL